MVGLKSQLLCSHIKDREDDPVQLAGQFPHGLLQEFANHCLAKWPGVIRLHIEDIPDEAYDILQREAREILQGTRHRSASDSDERTD